MPPPIVRPEGRLTLVDLPLETQQQIVGHVNRRDLFVFQRLSPHCFSLANAEIYRNLDLNITNSGDEENGIPNSHAADALQTILASEHDYGQHIKSFRLGVSEDNVDILPGAHPGRSDPLLMTRLLWDSKSDSSKFLNTALLLVTRKASILETFQWDAPIEMSGAVYQALHKTKSLRHLRVRLDVSPSPKMVIRHGLPPNPHHPPQGIHPTQGVPHPSQYVPPPPPGVATGPSNSYPSQAAAKMNNVKRKKAGGNGGCNYWANPRVFSGFKHLSTLALMGMSNLDCLPEIAECIKASSATLKCLTLSLSTDLARKARKPVPVNPELEDASDTELDEDEIMNDPLLPPTLPTQPTPSTNEADIRKEKVAQESILAKVFDLQSVAAEGKKIEKNLFLSGGQVFQDQDSEAITRKVNTLMKSLMDAPIATDADPTSKATRLEHFKMVREVADLYITSQNVQKKILKEQSKPPVPAAKKTASTSKPLNPLASDFKVSGLTTQIPGFSDWDSTALSSPTSPFFDAGISNSLLNGSAKNNASMGSFSTSTAPYSFNASSGNSKSPVSLPPHLQQVQQTQQLQQLQAQQQAQKIAQLKAQKVQAQAYMSPYGAGSYPGPPVPSSSLPPYPASHNSSPGLYDPSGLYNPYPLPSSNGLDFGNPPNPDNYILQAKKAKLKSLKAKKPAPAKAHPVADSDEESDIAAQTSPAAPQPFFAAEPSSEPVEDPMDVDMEHPDEDPNDLGEDQEIINGAEEVEIPTPRKRAKIGSAEPSSPNKGSSPSAQVEATSPVEAMNSDEAMQAYIRATHGLQLEALSLEWVPMKASIVARALDLSILKRITLLEVGSQDAFWTLLVRLQSSSTEIAFKSVHTDNVSLPFVKFLSTFENLEELFMHERGTKQGEDLVNPPPISITIIRKMGLQKHVTTLKRLMIRNERNESWDLDIKTLQFLALKGTEMRELAVSLNMKTYHVLMQYFAAFKNLYALHLVALRSGDRSMILQNESLNFAVDSLSHCRDMKIKYIAIVSSVIALESKPEQFKRHLRRVMEFRKDKKGKGKAPADAFSSLLEQFEDSGSDEVEEAMADFMAGESKLRFTTSFGVAEDVKIFSRQIRGGRL